MNVDKGQKSLLAGFYRSHHLAGDRLDQSFLEKERGSLFSEWIGTGKKVLDLGGRDGTLTKYFVARNDVTIGDIDPNALESAHVNLGVDTEFVNLNDTLPFNSGTFDTVVMAEVLEHLPYPRITLGEITRILRPGGQFVGNFPIAYHLKDRYRVLRGKKLVMAGDKTHLQFFTYDEALELLGDFFDIDNIEILKGGRAGKRYPRLFARNIAFNCTKK